MRACLYARMVLLHGFIKKTQKTPKSDLDLAEKMMEAQHISKAQLARDLETSRGAVDRILDSENTSMTLKSLGAIADLFGKCLEISLVDV